MRTIIYIAQIQPDEQFAVPAPGLSYPTHPLLRFNPELILLCLFVWFVAFIIKGGQDPNS